MTRIHVRYGLTPADERHLLFGARLAAALKGEMVVWLDDEEIVLVDRDPRNPELFGPSRKNTVRDTRDQAIRDHVRRVLDGKAEINLRFTCGDSWVQLLDPEEVLIGPRTSTLPQNATFIATMDEDDLMGRGEGPICVPFGKGDSGLRAAEAVLPMAAGLGLSLLFYHTTYPNSKLAPNSPPEQHMLSEVGENARVLREAADRRGVRHETVVEMADDIVGGLIRFALSRNCLLIAMARSGRIGRGSQTIQTMQRSVIPVLVAKGRI